VSDFRIDSPRQWGVTGSADWEAPSPNKPPDKRHPYDGECDFLEREARRIVGPRPAGSDNASWMRRVSAEFRRLIVRRRIYIEGL